MEGKRSMVCMGFGLITDDVRRLREFYTKVLGCPAEGDDIHTEMRCEGIPFVLYDKAASVADMAFSYDDSMGHGHTTVSFRVEDVDAEYARLQQMGVVFMTRPHTYPWGARSVHFRDPDGNIVTLVTPPKR